MGMKPEIKKYWIKALKSGDYQQGRHYLRDGDKFCCLGVLCDLAEKAEVLSSTVIAGHAGTWYRGRETGSKKVLPEEVLEWAGIFNVNPLVGKHTLAYANDAEGKTFTEIADLIEKYL